MKRLFHLLIHSLKTNGRDWTVFALSFLLAFSIWLIHNLSLEYSDFIRVQVRAESNIAGHSAESANTCEVSARCRTTGFNILKTGVFDRNVRKIVFKASDFRQKSADMFYLTSANLNEYAHEIFGEKAGVEYYLSDTLFFRFPVEASKRVPVHPVRSISFSPQYMGIGELVVEPDSVTISGEPYHLANVDRVFTETIKLNDLKTNTSGVVSLDKIRGIRMSEESVHYHIDVTRFVEMRYDVEISAKNVPADKEMMIYPAHAEVVVRSVFPLVSDLSDMTFSVDYGDFVNSRSGKCIARPDYLPEGIIEYELKPEIFECMLNEK